MRAPGQPPELPPKRLGVVFSFAGPLLNIGEAMPAKPPVIVHSTYGPKRARKRKQSIAIPMRIVTAKPPKNACSAERRRSGAGDREAAHRLGKEAEGRFGDVPDMAAEEHQRRGDAAEKAADNELSAGRYHRGRP